MKICLDCIHYPISKSLDSHRASWAKYWKYVIETQTNSTVDILFRNEHDRWYEYDMIVIYHGMEFNGALNLAGGIGDWHIERFNAFADFMKHKAHRKVCSIEHKMPNYYELLKKRGIDIPELNFKNETFVRMSLPNTKHIVLGDSHSLSVLKPKETLVGVHRIDFKTLHGALSQGFDSFLDFSNVETATFYFGNIDMRHHVLRHDDYKNTIDKLIQRYEYQLLKLQTKFGLKEIEVIQVLPMTNDDRKLPKSGFYENTPFYGDLKDRQIAIDYFNKSIEYMCKSNYWKTFRWPDSFKDKNGCLKDERMEKPRSVHLSQTSYRYDFENKKVRYE